jgi:Domain of unknown function (DUF4382)
MKKKFIVVGLFFAAALGNSECNKSGTELVHLNIKLTDGPADYQEVNIDLKGVQVNFRDDTTSWISLSTKMGIYNLLQLQNGLDTLIAEASLPAGTINEVRLMLGDNNSIKVNDASFPLAVPSGAESGLKIKVNKPLETFQTLTVDFDAGLSVNQIDTSTYTLRPVLKVQ